MMWSFFSRDSAKDFPYEIGEQVRGLETKSIWNLYKGKRKTEPKNEVSIFVYDVKGGSDTKLEIAKNAVKKLKTLRHPSILQFLDSVETDKVLYVATEYVEPLGIYLDHIDMDDGPKELYLAWGIFQITRALSFLNNDGNLRHNNVSCWSVNVNKCGEWKLGGLEYVSPVEGNPMPPIKVPPALEVYDPPEKTDPAKLKHATKW